MSQDKQYHCSECQFTASDDGIVRAHQGRVHQGFGTVIKVSDLITDDPDTNIRPSESPQ